jgi:NAD(P)-dependent dehydrogenase (short-subunit alcohol dehydrogenase family)
MANTVEATEENFDRTIAINLKGVWLCMKYEIPQMLKQGGGSIVNTASVAVLVGFHNLSAYNASTALKSTRLRPIRALRAFWVLQSPKEVPKGHLERISGAAPT